MMSESACTKCGANDWGYRGDRNSTRFCKPCKLKANRDYRRRIRAEQASPCIECGAAVKGRGRKRYCLTCVPDRTAYHRLVTFGLTGPMVDAMYFDQEGKCALDHCDNEATHVDHCHKTGKVRGLLCAKCNLGLHYIEHENFMVSAQSYLFDLEEVKV